MDTQILPLYLILIALAASLENAAQMRFAHRTAWTAAWSAVTCTWILGGHPSYFVGYCVYLSSALLTLPNTHRRNLKIAIFIGILIYMSLLFENSPSQFASGVFGLGVGLFNETLIRQNRGRQIRNGLYWACFIGTFFVLLPFEIASRLPKPIPVLMAHHNVVGFVLLVFGLMLWRLSFAELVQARGTPDPSDGPETLKISGIYRFIRHPMQIGHISVCFASALFFGNLANLIYAFVFTLLLTTLYRRIEESRLEAQYGQHYVRYQKGVPAYFPLIIR